MNLALLLPAALGALAAVLVPLAIHIARSTETRTIDFAALRWLDQSPKPVRRLRIDERLLLAVRILLIAAVVLALAHPVLRDLGDRRAVVAISPQVDPGRVPDKGERRVWLAPGFPSITNPAPPPPANLASLLRQLDAETPSKAAITVVVPPVIDGTDAERPRLSRRIDWRIAPAVRTAPTAKHPAQPALTVRYGPEAEDAVRYFRAAATAWTEPGRAPAFDAALADTPLPRNARYLVWLSRTPLSAEALAWTEKGGVVLLAHDSPSPVEGKKRIAWRDAVGEPLATVGRFGQGRVLQLTLPLEPAATPQLVDATFPDTLAALLAPPPPPARVAAADHAPTAGAAPYDPSPLDLRPWLAVLIALIFAAERWLATRRQRGTTP